MHLDGKCTTEDTCAYIVYLVSEEETTGRCGIHCRDLAKKSDFYVLLCFILLWQNNLYDSQILGVSKAFLQLVERIVQIEPLDFFLFIYIPRFCNHSPLR